MTIEVDPEDIDLIKEVGYEIVSAEREGTNITVKISTPDSTDGIRVHRFGLDHAEQVSYIKDGEVIEEPKALKKVKSRIEREMRALETISSKNLSDYNVLHNEQKLVELCESLR